MKFIVQFGSKCLDKIKLQHYDKFKKIRLCSLISINVVVKNEFVQLQQ